MSSDTNAARIAATSAALAAALDPIPFVDHPVEIVPAVPSAALYPGDPFLEPSDTYSADIVRLQVTVFASRMNAEAALELAVATEEPVRSALHTIDGGAWESMSVQPTEIAGQTYLAATHQIRGHNHCQVLSCPRNRSLQSRRPGSTGQQLPHPTPSC